MKTHTTNLLYSYALINILFVLAQGKNTNNIDIGILTELMSEESWKTEYKQWKNLKAYQIKLIDDGPQSQSQAWLLNSMWCDWMDLKKINLSEIPKKDNTLWCDPWDN